MKKYFLAVGVAALALLALGFWFWQQGRFSKEVVRLEVLAPDNAAFGEQIEYLVKIKNNGDVNLENVKLAFEYPELAAPEQDQTLRVNQDLEVIYPGQERTLSFHARLFGQHDDRRLAKVQLSYRPKGLNADFESNTSKTTVINSVPLTLGVDIPSKVDVNSAITFTVNYFSNIDYPLTDFRIFVDYPSGFEFIEAKPLSLSKNEWKLGLLNKAQGGRVSITGKFAGQVDQEQVLKVRAGIWQGQNFIPLKAEVKGLQLDRN